VARGDAEVLLLLPDSSERKTLAARTGALNLNEHFRVGIFFSTDSTAEKLLKDIADREMRRTPEAWRCCSNPSGLRS
jgi:hypothetical protein